MKNKNYGFSSDLQRSGYDRCRRGFAMNKRGSAQADALQDLKTENRGQSETLENMEGMIIKLINRWNQSDDKLDRKFDSLNKEINDLDNQVSEIKGSLSRVNGKH